MIETELIKGYRWTRRICYIIFFSCLLLISYTTIFFKEEYICGSSDAWWYEPEIGLLGKNLKSVSLMLLILLLNALPFYQWKGYTWRLPIYDFDTKWLHCIYTPISICHWIYYLLVVPFFIWFIYSPFDVNVAPYAPDDEMYGYHNDNGSWNSIIIYLLFFLGSVWIVVHEIILLIKGIRKRK